MAARIAYRLGENLYVADENGTNAVAVARAPAGAYSISPDGRTLAVVDGDTRQLVFLDVDSRTLVRSVLVSTARPVWMPDSSGVLVATTDERTVGARIQRVPRDGGAPSEIAPGGSAAVSPDAGTIVVGPDEGATGAAARQVVIVRGGKTLPVALSGPVTGLAAANNRVYAATLDERGAVLWWFPPAGGEPSPLVPANPGAPYTSLALSPDAVWLAYAAAGDDGYSRVSVLPAAGGLASRLWLRRDDYILQWSSDSKWVYVIEGNAFQGEPTSLYRVGRDGKGRRLIVQGASL